MSYRNAVPAIAWGALFFSLGFMAAVQLFAVGGGDALGKSMLSFVLVCAVLGLSQMAYKRARGDCTFGVSSAIDRGRAWGLFGASSLLIACSIGMAWTNS
jgi:hypothetical protein